MSVEALPGRPNPISSAKNDERVSPVCCSARIVVANGHAIVRAGLRSLLEGEPDFRVIGEAGSATDAVAIVSARKPDLLLLDASLPDASEMETLERLRGFPATRVILLAPSIDAAGLLRVLRLGARGVVLRDTETTLLFKSIRVVVAGEYWIARGAVAELVRALTDGPTHEQPSPRSFGLTARERRVVELVVAGHTNREISEKLTITLDTVKHHLTSIFDKTGASTRLELALFALHGQIVDRAS